MTGTVVAAFDVFTGNTSERLGTLTVAFTNDVVNTLAVFGTGW